MIILLQPFKANKHPNIYDHLYIISNNLLFLIPVHRTGGLLVMLY